MAESAPATDKKTKERSASYPGFTLESVIEFTQTLRTNLGSTSFSRESAAQALGHANLSGQASKKTAACVHFGLLTRSGNTYRQSELADQYFAYTSEDERTSALKEAVQKPTIYNKLIAKFNGQSLPAMLDNVLIREYGITGKAAGEAAKDFRSSLEFAGVLVNGVVNLDANPTSKKQDETGKEAPAQSDDNSSVASQGPNGAHQAPAGSLPVNIPGTEVTILFPIEYAYELSVGSFSEGIKALAENIKQFSHDTEPKAASESNVTKEEIDNGSDSPAE